MVSIEEALKIIVSQTVTLTTRSETLTKAVGHHLSTSVVSPFDLPPFDNSAMDGYAICGEADTYEITGEIAAGNTEDHRLTVGNAMRIFTGSKVPKNATAVIMQEKVEVSGNTLIIEDAIAAGKNIRPKGGELSEGQQVFDVGHLISPASVGVLGSLGLDTVEVYEKPKIRIISTGNELIQPGEVRKEGQIYESNSHALTAALSQHGFDCMEKQQIHDDFEAIKNGIGHYLEKSDVVLLSGGISVGDYDFVQQALIDNGVEELFYKIYQKPGKPLFFGRKENKFVFALPGNPASSLSCFFVYVLPLLQKLSGSKQPGLLRVNMALTHDYDFKSDRPSFLKAHIADHSVEILDGQSSSMIHTMALGNALALLSRPKLYKAGDMIECILI